MSEELFPPVPGGMVDMARKRLAAEQEQLAGIEQEAGPPADGDVVKVDVISPEVISARTFVVSTSLNPVLRVLGFDGNRKRATIMTLDQPVVVSASLAGASDPQNASNAAGLPASGFVLPVNVPLVVQARGELYVAATSATATRVSVLAETYAG